MSALKEQVIAKLEKIKDVNNKAVIPLGDIDKITTELIELFKKGDILLMREVVCGCPECKTKRDGWKM